MSLLEALCLGGESGTSRLSTPASSLRFVFQPLSNSMEEWWLPGTPFICTEITKGHESKLSGSAGWGGTLGGGHVRGWDVEQIRTSDPR